MSPQTGYAVNPGWALLLKDMGASEANVLRRAGLPRDLFSHQGSKVSTSDYYAMWEALAEEMQDPTLPIKVVGAISTESFDPVVFAATCSKNLNVAAARIAQHEKLIAPKRLVVEQTSEGTELELRWPELSPPPPAMALTELLFWVALARLATRAHIRPSRISTPHPPSDAEAYFDYLGVHINEGPSYRVVFSAADALRPFLTANEGMWAFFEPELRKRLSDLDADATTAERVRAALLELLPVGRSSMDSVANELAVSTRTLQRRLSRETTSYQAVLSETRESLARHYLSSSSLPIDEISFLLGYEDAHSFYRAFKDWTGLTPQGVRSGATI